ncbi:MAG: hypothetical protein ABSC25_26665 [Roseiarcus sp.]
MRISFPIDLRLARIRLGAKPPIEVDGIEPRNLQIEIQVACRELFEFERQIRLVPRGMFRETIVAERDGDLALRGQMRNSMAGQMGLAGPLGGFPASVSEEDIVVLVDADDACESKLANRGRDLLNLTFRMFACVPRVRLEVVDRHVFDDRSTQRLRRIGAGGTRPLIPIWVVD